MVHKALQVPEILAAIFGCFEMSQRRNGTLVCLARTCRAFFPIALAIIWKDVGFHHLLAVLPLEVGSQDKKKFWWISKSLTTDHVARFNLYSNAVMKLFVSPQATPIARDVVLALIQGQAKLSSVQELRWTFAPSYTALALLLDSSLKRLIIERPRQDDPDQSAEIALANESMVYMVCSRCPDLELLTWKPDSAEFPSTVGYTVLNLRHIKYLSIPLHGTHAPLLLENLSRMRNLKRLEIRAYSTTALERPSLNFEWLEEFSIDGVGSSLLEILKFPNLSNLRCAFTKADLMQVCKRITGCASPRLSKLTISTYVPHQDPLSCIEYLRKFSRLQSFSISIKSSFPSTTTDALSTLLGTWPELQELRCSPISKSYYGRSEDDSTIRLTLAGIVSCITNYPHPRCLEVIFDARASALPVIPVQPILNRPFHLIAHEESTINNVVAVAQFLHALSFEEFKVTSAGSSFQSWLSVARMLGVLDRMRAGHIASEAALVEENANLRRELENLRSSQSDMVLRAGPDP